jgi:hypothetical protein
MWSKMRRVISSSNSSIPPSPKFNHPAGCRNIINNSKLKLQFNRFQLLLSKVMSWGIVLVASQELQVLVAGDPKVLKISSNFNRVWLVGIFNQLREETVGVGLAKDKCNRILQSVLGLEREVVPSLCLQHKHLHPNKACGLAANWVAMTTAGSSRLPKVTQGIWPPISSKHTRLNSTWSRVKVKRWVVEGLTSHNLFPRPRQVAWTGLIPLRWILQVGFSKIYKPKRQCPCPVLWET